MPRFLFVFLAFAILCGSAQAQSRGGHLLAVRGADTPILLDQAAIDVDIGGGIAATTIELAFRNPNPRALEGELQFPLAPGQRVTGFALDFNGEMRPAVPVDKTKGRQVFEAIERRGVDPALLEATRGENFKLRIYPIPAHGTRRVRLQIAQTLERDGASAGWRYRLPVPYAADAQTVTTRVVALGSSAPTLPEAPAAAMFDSRPGGFGATLPRTALAGGALTLAIPADASARAYAGALGAESYFHVALPVASQGVARRLPKVVGLLWDSSGSGAARRHDLEFALLDRYFQADGDVEVRLVRLRDRPEAERSFRIHGGDWRALRRELEATVYDGATALGGWTPAHQVGEYLLVSDGLDNYGAAGFPVLAPTQRLFALNAAAGADTGHLSALAGLYRGRLVDPLAGGVDAASRALLEDGVRIDALDGDGVADLQAASNEPQGGMLHVAGRLLRPDGLLRVVLVGPDGARRTASVPVTATAPQQALAPQLWAGWRIDALQADYEGRRAEIARLGRRFGIVTRDTSLIVLEGAADYARYDIAPPESLRAEVERLTWLRRTDAGQHRTAHLERIVREVEDKWNWWNDRYPKLPPAKSSAKMDGGAASFAPPPPPPWQPMVAAPAPAPAVLSDGSVMRRASPVMAAPTLGPHAAASAQTPGGGAIALRRWTPDARHVERMHGADAAQAYAIYLDEKPDFANSTAFYLDVADALLDKGARDLALRVLSNLAEMDLENHHVLRVLGYRLLQAGAPELAVPVFETVRRLAPSEPQSWRDLGLAYAAVKRPQEAVDALYEVVTREWDARFADVELIALADIDAIVTASHGRVDTGRIDPRLLRHMPLDLRAVLTWDSDNSDMDLWVTDPDGETCKYSNRNTALGGRITHDATGGYGPEEFSLRRAKPGKYKVEANFFGDRQQIVTGATTLQVKLTTGFATPQAQERLVTLRLAGRGDTVFVGEFEVPGTRR